LIWFGPVPATTSATCDRRTVRGRAVGPRGHHQRQAGEVSRALAGLRRQAQPHVVVLAVGARQLPTACPASSGRSAPATALTFRPRSAAASRFSCTAHRGLVGLERAVQVDQAGDAGQLRRDLRGQPLQLGQVGPCTENCRVLPPPRSVTPMLVTVMPGMRASRSRIGTTSWSTLRWRSLRSTRRT
jgi:hypothetical protein